jgi:predicted Zn-dependent protease
VIEQARALPHSAYAQQTLGDLWAARGQVAEAQSAWEEALRSAPYSPQLWERVADAARRRGDTARAAAAQAERQALLEAPHEPPRPLTP